MSFDEATFNGGQVFFGGATFGGGEVSFDGAVFGGGQVSFRRATFSGGQVLLGAALIHVPPVFDAWPGGAPPEGLVLPEASA
ncbi:hypothetical protein DKT68_05585 [Micromonospora acroterricola]|uniref:Pentapeptide repeat-containing protein n=1 Tax=Micromonospora acroterricola TaxID=2202421 RepID=A0A317D9R6_9ACTN|nr:pentapeptide repeat-containing protein [Micromonospora acroterricola]PWR11499.1 hypothetical protein DKT68_05585 [Micromonospora acroterricola]